MLNKYCWCLYSVAAADEAYICRLETNQPTLQHYFNLNVFNSDTFEWNGLNNLSSASVSCQKKDEYRWTCPSLLYCSINHSPVAARVSHRITFKCSDSISFSGIHSFIIRFTRMIQSRAAHGCSKQNSHERMEKKSISGKKQYTVYIPWYLWITWLFPKIKFCRKKWFCLDWIYGLMGKDNIKTSCLQFRWMTAPFTLPPSHAAHSWKEWGLHSCFCWDEASSIQLFHSFKCLHSKTPSKAYSLILAV